MGTKIGFGISTITPRVGAELDGYRDRPGPSIGIHDELHSRSLVVEADDGIWALCANELLFVTATMTQRIRDRVTVQVPILTESIHICTVHNHSGPRDLSAEDWDVPLEDLIAASVVQAYENRVPARIGFGRGRLDGHSVNRRFLDCPTDPGMAVLKVEDLNGRILGLVVNWGCHAVVMGPDNLLISADYPGVVSSELESRAGDGSVALFVNGGCGDVNPVTSGVRTTLDGSHPIRTMVPGVTYYQPIPTSPTVHIGHRHGGTFAEVEELGHAVADEAWRVAERAYMREPVGTPWTATARLNLRRPDADPISSGKWARRFLGDWSGEVEVAALGIDEFVLVGEPGEVFAETFVDLKRELWQMGFQVAMTAGYMNGGFGYLPPREAFAEGGYEIDMAKRLGLREDTQERMRRKIIAMVLPFAPIHKRAKGSPV